jgi:energy-coupling factor transporter ATP-binding protein EcfA2
LTEKERPVVDQNNPFPAGGLPTAFEIWADRKEIKSSLKRAFDLAFATPETMVIQIVGDTGSGKTHTLKHFRYLFQKGWGKVTILPILLDRPGLDNLDFYNRFLSSIKMNTVVTSLKDMLADVVLARSKQLQVSRAEGDVTGSDVVDVVLDQRSLVEEVRKELIEVFRGIGPREKSETLSDYWEHLATALTRLLMGPDEVFAAGKWLNFQTLYKTDREALNNIPAYEPTSTYAAASMVGMMRLIAHRKHYDKVVIFIDEVETITEAPATPKGLASIAQCLRDLIDAGLRELVLVLGSTVSAEDVFAESQSLLRRIHMTVKLDRLQPSDAIDLVSDYLAESTGRKEKDIFRKESITMFNDAAKGIIYTLIQILHLAYAMYLQNKENWDMVGKDEADKVLKRARELGVVK